MGGGLTGAMMNPARAFGPQLVGDEWSNWWVWYIGPLAGGVIAAIIFEFLYLQAPGRASDAPDEAAAPDEPGPAADDAPEPGTAASDLPIR